MKSRTAEQKIDSLMAFYNDNPQSLVFSRLADVYRKEGNYSKAVEICINGLQNHPEYVTGRVVLGQCYYEQGNVQAALQEFLTVCSYDRKNHIAIKMLADLYSRQKLMDKAGDLYNLLHRMDPGNNSIRQLTKQFLPSGQTDLFAILGLHLPKSAVNIQSAFQNQQQNDSFPENDQYQEINNIQDSTSTIEEIAPAQISSDDLNDRMDTLFGNDQQEELESQPIQENSLDSATENNDSDTNITGDDISNRMDAMFGGDSANAENDSSPIAEISGDDVSNHIGMLEGNDVEELSISSAQYDNSIQNESNQESTIDTTSNESIITGDELSNHLDNILNDNNEQTESGFSDPDAIELTGADEQDVTGNDIALQIDSIIPDDVSSNNLSLESNAQEIEIQNDTADDAQELLSSDDSITGDDLISHLDNISGEDSSDNSTQFQSVNSFSNQNNEQPIPAEDSDQSDAPQAFDTEIQMDAVLNMDDSISQSDVKMDDQTFDFSRDMNSEQPNESNDIVSGDDVSFQLDNLINQDTDDNISEIEEIQSVELKTDSVYPDDSNDSGNSAGNDQINNFEITQQIDAQGLNDQITGNDVCEHIDKILGNSNQSDGSPIYDKINSDQDDKGSQSDQLIDDRTDQIDMASITRSLSDESDFPLQDNLNADENQSKNDLISEELTVPDDEAQKDVKKAAPIDSNLSPFSSLNNSEFEETLQFDRSIIDDAANQASNDQTTQDTNDKTVDLNKNKLNPFDFENETLSIDRAELNSLINNTDQLIDDSNHQTENMAQSDNESQKDEELILDVDNQSSAYEPSENIHDVSLENDSKIISDMDILISPASDTQVVTGDDVVEKLDSIFPSEKNSDKDPEFSSNYKDNQQGIINSKDIDQNTESNDSFDSGDGDKQEMFSEDNFSEDNLIALNEDNDDKDIVFSEDEPAEQIQNSKDTDSNEDTETNDTSLALVDSENEEINTDSGTINDTERKEEQQDSSENSNEELDERDRPYSIPDHVLTPTLADIYFQQGQLQLAVQIYSRLVEKDPDNDRLRERLEEIQKRMLAQKDESQSEVQKTIEETTEPLPKNLTNNKQKKKTSEIDRPLAGVRLKKAVKKRKAGSK